MLKLEFHCHSIYSRDSLTSLKSLLQTARRKGLQRLVITDHDTISGALKARDMDPELFIIGEEIMTQSGELLAAFVKEEIPPGLTAAETIARLREQGAFISVSHPFDRMRAGHWQLPALQAIVPDVDAIETFNARCFAPRYNQLAQDFARENGLLGTAGSDAHAAFEVGRAVMLLPDFRDAAGLKAALSQARFEVSLSSPWVHLTSRYAVWRKKIRGLATTYLSL